MIYVCGYLFLRFQRGRENRQINPSKTLMNLQYTKYNLSAQLCIHIWGCWFEGSGLVFSVLLLFCSRRCRNLPILSHSFPVLDGNTWRKTATLSVCVKEYTGGRSKCINQSINQSIIRFVLRHSTTVLMVQDNVTTTGKKDVSSIRIWKC